MKTIKCLGLSLVVTAMLAACGGGDTVDPTQARGAIVSAQLLQQMSKAAIDASTAASGRQTLTGAAQCDVDIRHVQYMTRDPKGQPATATTAVMVPTGAGANCSGNRPVLGLWVVAGEACGMGIREEASPITTNAARFIPHVIE